MSKYVKKGGDGYMYKLLFVLCLLVSNIAYADTWKLTK